MPAVDAIRHSQSNEMESGSVSNPNVPDETKEAKAEVEETNSTSATTQVAAKEGPATAQDANKESQDTSIETQNSVKRPAEGDDDNDEEGKRKRRKGIMSHPT